ncbi:hypothetical protein H2515_13365 [Acidithiobacillus ferrivorans]|uniref:Uncharacterized protein n=1 Tax=Acidithiobacillus ferrivorans TaxID=160808 RepID=A0A7T5BHN1_9PROT|nr:hypothetical protein H2515_13365 [Acidithiobacillus ferrivorans]
MITAPLTATQRRTLRQVGIAFMLLASLLTALYIQQSQHLHRVAAEKIKLHASLSAQSAALQVAAVFNKYFDNLVYVGNVLLPQDAGVQTPGTRTLEQVQILRAQYPNVMAINLQNSLGDRILWSTLPQSSQPISLANDFTPLPGHPNRLIGKLHYAQRMHARVITMRYRVHDAGGAHLLFSVGSPINIMSLDTLTILPNYDLFLLDAQHVPFVFFRQGKLSLSGPSLQSFPQTIKCMNQYLDTHGPSLQDGHRLWRNKPGGTRRKGCCPIILASFWACLGLVPLRCFCWRGRCVCVIGKKRFSLMSGTTKKNAPSTMP